MDVILNSAEKYFKTKAIQKNNLILFHKCDMIEIIKYCQKERLDILGIDGFFLLGDDKIIPSIEHSIDFSNDSNKHMNKDSVYFASMKFIEKQDESLVFEIITG